MIDYAVQRANMVDSQVRPADITDRRIIRAMLAVPREAFAPPDAKSISYADDHLVVGAGRLPRFVLAPRTFAKLVQLLAIGEQDLVLDVGCATGYSTAVLARLAGRVIGLEEDVGLAERARRTLEQLQVANVDVRSGSLAQGCAAAGPFDAILINGCIEARPDALLDQLKDGGRLAAVESSARYGRATLWRRIGSAFDSRPAFDAAAPMLPGFKAEAGFVF
jgi:protein-L-isoaspartate(D-aspartate) O-methyltransferase